MTAIPQVLDALKDAHGPQPPPPAMGVFELILWELVAYLADDHRRAAAFATLKADVGTTPDAILEAAAEDLLAAARFGIVPDQTVDKLRKAAAVALADFAGDVELVKLLPLPDARKALMRFPSIGAPGADKILLLSGAYPVFAVDSNALRVLLRLGFGTESSDYARSYRSSMEAADVSTLNLERLVQLSLLLRTHGQKTCRRNQPKCAECPLAGDCDYASATRQVE